MSNLWETIKINLGRLDEVETETLRTWMRCKHPHSALGSPEQYSHAMEAIRLELSARRSEEIVERRHKEQLESQQVHHQSQLNSQARQLRASWIINGVMAVIALVSAIAAWLAIWIDLQSLTPPTPQPQQLPEPQTAPLESKTPPAHDTTISPTSTQTEGEQPQQGVKVESNQELPKDQ
jgi:cytoskeletal protein RodZ